MSHAKGVRHSRTRFRFEDDVHDIRVVDVYPDRCRHLQFEDSAQGALSLDDPAQPVFEYIALMAESWRTLIPSWESVEVAGLGAGALVHMLAADRPHGSIMVVESVEKVIDVARRFFRIPRQAQIVHRDAREFLINGEADSVDLYLMDCYGSQMMPAHLCTLEFLRMIRSRLKGHGMAIWNLWSLECNAPLPHQLATIGAVFTWTRALRCAQDQNLVVCASMEARDGKPIVHKRRSYEWLTANAVCDEKGTLLTDENLALVLLDLGVG